MRTLDDDALCDDRLVGGETRSRGILLCEGPMLPGSPLFERALIRDFRGIERLDVPLVHESLLPGHWTCIAGVNGAGKTSVLQAIALTLLGVSYALELRTGFLHRLRRERGSVREASLRVETADTYWPMKLLSPPDDSHATYAFVGGGQEDQRSVATRLPPLVLGYGATRNLSEFEDGRWVDASPQVRRVVTLFDPLTRVIAASALVAGIEDAPGWRLFAELLERLPLPLQLVTLNGRRWLDRPRSARGVALATIDGVRRPTDLPDGYRSTLAWLADLCLQHAEVRPTVTDLAGVSGLVLIDEIDLHLHPALQRALVPALREALPNVQWVVTTHSPLVLTCFDMREIIALDRDAEGGIRELDRQIMGFSADDVYSWLMGTSPTGAAATTVIREQPEEAEVMLRSSPKVGEAEARQTAETRRDRLRKVLGNP